MIPLETDKIDLKDSKTEGWIRGIRIIIAENYHRTKRLEFTYEGFRVVEFYVENRSYKMKTHLAGSLERAVELYNKLP